MGVSHSLTEFTGKIERAGTNVAGAKRPAMTAAASTAKTVMAQSGPSYLRGVGRKGARIGVKYTLYGDNKAVVRWYGPAHLVNNPNRPHVITARGLRGSRKSRQLRVLSPGRTLFGGFGKAGARALAINGDLRAYAHHPGTRGKRFFQRSKPKVITESARAYNRTVTTAVTSALR